MPDEWGTYGERMSMSGEGLDPNGSAVAWAWATTRRRLNSFVGGTILLGVVGVILATTIGSPGSGASKVLVAVLVFLLSAVVGAGLIFAVALVQAVREQRDALRRILRATPSEPTTREIRDGLALLYRDAQEVGMREPTGIEWIEMDDGQVVATPVGVTEAESAEWVQENEAWFEKATHWISENMSKADAEIFKDISAGFSPQLDDAREGYTTATVIVARHSLQLYMGNLMEMMRG